MSTNPSTLAQFRQNFKGIRANRYSLSCPFPTGLGGGSNLNKIYVRALSLPGSNIGMIPVAYQGRIIKFSGERQFGEWNVIVYDSSLGAGLRKELENWMQKMDDSETHAQNHNLTATKWTLKYGDDTNGTHTGFAGPGATRQVELYGVWPMDISPVDLSHDSYDTFAEFSLTIAYDYHKFV